MKVTIEFLMMDFPGEGKMTLLTARDSAGVITGTVTIDFVGRLCTFKRLFVQTAFQRMGIGKQLLQAITNMAQIRQCESLSCIVHPDNVNAQAFYRSLGFFHATTFDDGGWLMTIQL